MEYFGFIDVLSTVVQSSAILTYKQRLQKEMNRF